MKVASVAEDEESVLIVAETPIAVKQNVFAVSDNGFFLKIEELLNELEKIDFDEDLPERYRRHKIYLLKNGEHQVTRIYKASIIGTVKNGILEQTSETPESGEEVSFYSGNNPKQKGRTEVFRLVHEADYLSLEEELKVLEGRTSEDIEEIEGEPIKLCPHAFKIPSKTNDSFSNFRQDIGSRYRFYHTPKGLAFKKNLETDQYEIYQHTQGDENPGAALWTAETVEELIQKIHLLQGFESYEAGCSRTTCPKKNPIREAKLTGKCMHKGEE